jgi:glyoxylate utilization-related uncharacterized protein
MLSYLELGPNIQYPVNTHEAERIKLVSEGELSFALEGSTGALSNGMVIAMPCRATHSVSTGSAPCKAVVV